MPAEKNDIVDETFKIYTGSSLLLQNLRSWQYDLPLMNEVVVGTDIIF